MKVTHPNPGTLHVARSRTGAGLSLTFSLLFWVAWYSFLVLFHSVWDELSDGDADAPQLPILFMLLFWVAPLFHLPEIFRQVRVMTHGETFTLSRDSGIIERNQTRVARFDEVERIQIRVIRDSNNADEHRLSIVLKDDKKLRIHQSKNQQEVADIAEDLADLLDVEITRKS